MRATLVLGQMNRLRRRDCEPRSEGITNDARNTRSVAVLVLSVTLIATLATPTFATPGGNAADAAMCENGGYLNYTDDEGNGFRNVRQCTRYAAQGGTLVDVISMSISAQVGPCDFIFCRVTIKILNAPAAFRPASTSFFPTAIGLRPPCGPRTPDSYLWA